MYLKSVITASIVGVILTGCSLLKPHYSDEQMHSYLFNKFDSDKDSQITEAEYMEFIDERFVKMDTDKNGTISKDDLYNSRFYTFLPELAEAVFRDSDTDMDGLITKEEMIKAEEIRFKQMDVNGDGILTKEEFIVNDMSEFKK
ncbi:MAG: EF-hand domain-containing protein [Helicobacteraceae bacterium]|jgi:Ca2+-binding EF-hand superfamily protein|nr:EF-hand domain-containing protein [Helicobacteraceae bacterium]